MSATAAVRFTVAGQRRPGGIALHKEGGGDQAMGLGDSARRLVDWLGSGSGRYREGVGWG
uniref:Uncharacterized protein n=1 Tax=Oryza sativa subsp. japonica TaxID=39947 RepID=Q69PK6_ORYSJ|nr:hypothetical protein [Oryza sativa Japonica Group]